MFPPDVAVASELFVPLEQQHGNTFTSNTSPRGEVVLPLQSTCLPPSLLSSFLNDVQVTFTCSEATSTFHSEINSSTAAADDVTELWVRRISRAAKSASLLFFSGFFCFDGTKNTHKLTFL